jgi:hypothetical protein
VVFGLIARSQIKQTGQDGSGLATAGIVIGSLLTLFFVVSVATGGGSFEFSTGP